MTNFAQTNPNPIQQPASNNLSGFSSLVSPILNAAQASGQQQTDALQQQIQLALGGQGQSAADLQQQAGFQQQQIGLQQQGVGLQQQYNPLYQSLTEQGFGLTQQGFGLSGQQIGLQNASLEDQAAQAQFGYGQQYQSNQQGAAARGALATGGYEQQQSDLAQQLQFQLQGIDRSRQQVGIQGQQLGLQEQQFGLGKQREELQYQQGQKQLDLTAKQLGLSSQEVQARLQSALDQLGLSTALSVNQLMAQIGQVQAGEYSPIAGMLGDLYSLSGIRIPGVGDTQSAATGNNYGDRNPAVATGNIRVG